MNNPDGSLCKNCKHYTMPRECADDSFFKYAGECKLHHSRAVAEDRCPIDGAYGITRDEDSCGPAVGPDFGCIKWEGKE